MKMLEWFSAWASVIGAYLTATKMPQFGYPIMLAGALGWCFIAWRNRDKPLLMQNVIFSGANVLGILNY